MPRRLAIYSTLRFHPWGAPDTLWTRIALEAVHAGHSVFAVIRAQIAARPEIEGLRAAGVQLSLVPELPRGGRATRLAATLHNLRTGAQGTYARLRSFRPDFLLINQAGFYDFTAEDHLRVLIAAARIPYAVLAHSNCESPAMDQATRQLAVDFIRGAKSFLAISRFVLELAERQLLVPIANGAVFQNPIDLPGALPLAWPPPAASAFAVVSRLDAHGKGLDVLLPALCQAPGLREKWHLNVYGQGPDRDYLEALARHCGLTDRVTFHGYVADKVAIWRANHLLLLPSRWEGCSYSMIEALLCGRPVLRTNYGGVAEWMRDGVNGFVCAAPEPDLLARTLSDAWAQRDRWPEMGRAGHAHAASLVNPHPERQLLALLE